ncbi:putative RDD family membrane protein YckC [Micromonospora sp. M71_S20]|uniref:RDD family protein n=1 Tax=Micromonospora sp. M71_S20 TaxID=592872 RepID=UPI000EABF325|nr:RDD family protein [Micromonospora sp. M71_S20]RLK08800.1 putative RDD family membrane protein YckC [Micromonospora sp. M71_S20]
MTQPPTYPTPPAGGPPPAAGGFAPPAGPANQGYAVPPQHAPPGQVPPPGWAPPPPGWTPPPPGWAGPPRPAPALGPGGRPLASFGDRLLAALIDGALSTAVAMVLFLPPFLILFWNMMDGLTRTNPDGTLADPDPASFLTDFMLPILLLELGLLVVMLGLYWLYHVEYMKRTGQTYGKRVMKLRVVPLDPAATLDRRMAGRRYAVQYVAAMFLPGLSYLDGLWQLWDKPWQQCLHDKFAGTVVVKVSA